MNTQEEYLNALDWIHSTSRFGSKLGLDRIRRMLAILDCPQDKVKHFHVAGTNGKGSVTAMLSSVLQASGYRTGMYISPYLEDFRERISIQGQMIPKDRLVEVAGRVRATVGQILDEGYDQPTEFEIITAAAFLYFARERCDYVALEVGLGGRFDATNVITPAVSVITTISLDHTDRLGNTLDKIAFEKAGIIKPGIPVVTGAIEALPFSVIDQVARENGCRLVTVGQRGSNAHVIWEEKSRSLESQVINVFGPDFEYRDLKIPLMGRHQQQNAAITVAAIEAAAASNRTPLYLDSKAVSAGIAKTVWPARFEIMSKKPLVIIDGAHNPAGTKVLSEAMKNVPRNKLICVYGILGDKSYKEATSFIAPICDEIIVTTPDTPRALDPKILKTEIEKHSNHKRQVVSVVPDYNEAFDLAWEKAGEEDVILCCGSFYLIGPLRTHIRNKLSNN